MTDEYKLPVSDPNGFDEFLQLATIELRELWEERQGRKLSLEEVQSLNDVLEAYFLDKTIND